MKFLQFFLLTKWKGKEKLMRDKMRSEHVEIREIKWKKAWNNDIEEKWRDDTCCNCKAEKSRTTCGIE